MIGPVESSAKPIQARQKGLFLFRSFLDLSGDVLNEFVKTVSLQDSALLKLHTDAGTEFGARHGGIKSCGNGAYNGSEHKYGKVSHNGSCFRGVMG